MKSELEQLLKIMKEKEIAAYLITSSDFHNSEYIGDYFKTREFISGFTGSAGTLVVMENATGLWTDGRYFIQAKQELLNSGIELYEMGQSNVPTIIDFLNDKLSFNQKLGFDGRQIAALEGQMYQQSLRNKNIQLSYEEDLVAQIWHDRPNLATNPAFLLSEEYTGESIFSKLKRLRKVMINNKTDAHLITTLDEIAWLFNMRGNDISFSPLVLAYAYLTLDEVHLFLDASKLNEELKQELLKVKTQLHDYQEITEFIKNIKVYQGIMVDKTRVNYLLYQSLPQDIQIVDKQNPCVMFKCVKNELELANIRQAQIKDSIVFTKFMYWLKTSVNQEKITEQSALNKLEQLRQQFTNYLSPAFATISAYKEHAAIMHYSVSAKSDYEIKNEGLYLCDSGAHFLEGTTDITRTFVLGQISEKQRSHFTAVVQGMLRLSNTKFLAGTRGFNLDAIARAPIWQLNLDYLSGTGHGIGYLTNVHEAPIGIRQQINDLTKLSAGMLLSNEPGIYIEGSHGIRIENDLIINNGIHNEQGQFLEFETVTLVPIDLDGIELEALSDQDKQYLNDYHQRVYQTIATYLNDEEKIWLKKYTRTV